LAIPKEELHARTALAVIAWSVGPTVGKTHHAETINPLGLMTTPADAF